jgi:hypothetical protein
MDINGRTPRDTTIIPCILNISQYLKIWSISVGIDDQRRTCREVPEFFQVKKMPNASPVKERSAKSGKSGI